MIIFQLYFGLRSKVILKPRDRLYAVEPLYNGHIVAELKIQLYL